MAGLPLLATLMGFFAVCEILKQTKYLNLTKELITVKEKVPIFPPFDIIKKNKFVLLISAIIGTWIGILPGVGQSTGSLMAYNQARQMSKNPEIFGTGCEEGIIASEAANNAVNGGAMIPMMTLGIPGDLVTAILLGGLVIHGLQPGPMLFRNSQDVVGVVFIAYFLSNIIMFIVSFILLRFFIKLLKVSPSLLFPVILIMCVLGTFTVNNRLFDVWVLLFMGILGYLFLEMGFRLPPIILGYILSPIVEQNFRSAYISSRGNILDVFTRPLSGSLMIIAAIFLLYPYIASILRKRKLNQLS
jgi:putative tricarboxylic transport membrane protein